MIYIQINGKRVNLGEDFRIDLIIENPMFLTERIPFPYTTSADLPMTPENKDLLQQAQRVNITLAGRKWEFDAAILGFGARPLFYGLFIIQEIRQRFSWSFQASDDLSGIRKNMNKIDLGQINFGLGTFLSRTNPDWNPGVIIPSPAIQAYADYMNEARLGLKDFTVGSIRTSNRGFTTRFEGNDLIYLNSLWGQNEFFNPSSYLNQFVIPLETGQDLLPSKFAHSVIYPQIRAGFFLKKLLGIADEFNPFLTPDLEKVVLTSHYHPNFRDDLVTKWSGVLLDNPYPTPGMIFENFNIKLSSYQPALSGAEALKSLLNVVAGTIFRYNENGQNVYKIKLAKDIISDMGFQDWDQLLGTKLWLSREAGQNYIYGYDDFNEEDAAIDPGSVLPSIDDLLTAPVNEVTQEQLYYIQTTRQLILKKQVPSINEGEPDRFNYEVKHSGLSRPQADSGYQITSLLGPMKMAPVVNLNTYIPGGTAPSLMEYMPIYEGGRDVNYTPHLMIYHGPLSSDLFNPDSYHPYLSYHNYDKYGNKIHNLSLQWDGPDGLIENFHKDFKLWVERDKLVAYGEFIFSPYFLRDIDLAKKILVRNKKWWIKKIVVPMSKKKINPAQVDLIESQDPSTAGSSSSGSGSGSGSSPGSSGPGSSNPPALGTCYTITIQLSTFDPVADYFNITRRIPGSSETTAGFDSYTRFAGPDLTEIIAICSDIEPIFTQSGQAVASVNGVVISTGGSCAIDGQCAP